MNAKVQSHHYKSAFLVPILSQFILFHVLHHVPDIN